MSTPVGNSPAPAPDGGCLGALFSGVLLLAGGLVVWGFFLEPWTFYLRARSWPAVPCTVIASRMEPIIPEGRKKPTNRERLDLRYSYTFEGRRYVSAGVWFVKPDRDEVREILVRYPKNAAVSCWVDPADPAVAVLERDFRPQLLVGLFPLGMSIAGLVGLLAHGWRRLLGERRAPGPPPGHVPVWGAPPGRARPLVHRAPHGGKALLAVAAFALVWNAIVWLLVQAMVQSWSEGLDCHGIFLTFFVIPFILLGLAMAVLTVYLLIKLFNPRSILSISVDRARPGESVEIHWRFAGRAGMIRRLRLCVEGREEATYARGATTVTDREVFRTITLVDTTRRQEIRHGKASFTIPADAIPSFDSGHNRIAWAVRITGTIPRFPDVDEDVEFAVLPAAVPESAGASA